MTAEVTQLITIEAAEHVAELPFYIPMTGPATRPRRSLKHDDTFIVLDSHGDIGASAGGPDGLFNADTRYLARLEMVLDDVQPLLLGSNLRDDNSALTVDLTNSDVYRNGRLVLQKDTLHIVRSIFLWRGTAYQRIALQNHGDRPASFDLTLLFDNDFADLFEVRGERRPRRGVGSSRLLGPADVVLEYSGLDGQVRITALHFEPRPTRLAITFGDLSFRAGAEGSDRVVRRGILQQADHAEAGAVLPRPAGAPPRDAALDGGRGQHRDVERYLQRGAVPGDGRPQHADDGNAAGPIPLCRHSLVFDHVRPRRTDHRAADAVDRSAHRAGRAAAACLLPGQDDRSARRCRARQDPARDARRRDGGAARGAVRAVLRQRRFDAAVRAAGRPLCRTHRRRGNAGRVVAGDRSGACNGSTVPAIPTRTASSNTSAPPSRGLPTRAGRIPSMRSSMPMDNSPRAISRWRRFRDMSLPASGWRRAAPGASD